MTTRGCAVVDQIVIPRDQWLSLLAELRRRGRGRHESGAFLLGHRDGDRRVFKGCVFYDDLDPKAYSTGVCVLYADAFDTLWGLCRQTGLTVIADVHTHMGHAGQSPADRENPMIARAGHLAIIVERFARDPVWRHRLGLYRYEGAHCWTDLGGLAARQHLKTGTFA